MICILENLSHCHIANSMWFSYYRIACMAIEKVAAYSVWEMKCIAKDNSWKEQLSVGGGS